MASPWRTTFNEIKISCRDEDELAVRVADMTGRGFKLIDTFVESKRYRAASTYEKHIAIMRRVSE